MAHGQYSAAAVNRKARRRHLQGRGGRVRRGRVPLPSDPGKPILKLVGPCDCRLCLMIREAGGRRAPYVDPGDRGAWPGPMLGTAPRPKLKKLPNGEYRETTWRDGGLLSYECLQVRRAPLSPAGSATWSGDEDRLYACGCGMCRAELDRRHAPPPEDDQAGPELVVVETPDGQRARAGTIVGAENYGRRQVPQVIKRNPKDERETRAAYAKARAEGWREMADGKWVREENSRPGSAGRTG